MELLFKGRLCELRKEKSADANAISANFKRIASDCCEMGNGRQGTRFNNDIEIMRGFGNFR